MINPTISIILPFYNSSQSLANAIQSILDQTFTDFEFILVNNNSADKSETIAKQLAENDSRIKLLTETQQGVVFAANAGMKAAKGKYIARTDADDVAHPKRLEKQLRHLEANPNVSICATQVNYKTENQELTDFTHFVEWSNALTRWKDIYTNRFVELPVVNPTLMFRKSILDDVGYFREGNFPEDYEWFLRAMDKGHSIEKLPLPLLDWHDSSNRLTRTDNRYENDAFFQLKTEYLAKHLKSNNQTKVWIWGAGKLAYKRSQWLLKHGIKIEGYVDIKKDKQLPNHPCEYFQQISRRNQPFIISYVTNRNKREEVRAFLDAKEYKESEDYIIAG